MRILSVDDDLMFLEIIRAELQGLGYSDVHQVTSGAEAIDLVRTAKAEFDCFLLDIDMPGMDGVELCARLRSEERAKEVPIVMVTSRAEIENVDRAFAAGATDYLNKPLDRRELRGRLSMVEGISKQRNKVASDQFAGERLLSVEQRVRLDPSAGCIDFLAMQNLLLKLGAMEMFNRVLLGFHISNIHEIFLTRDQDGFCDTLCDVSEILVEALGSRPKFMSYAGSGDFIVILDRFPTIDVSVLADQIGLSIETLGQWYSSFGEITPSIKIGKPISRNLLSLIPPDEMLDKAIAVARKSELEAVYSPKREMPKRSARVGT